MSDASTEVKLNLAVDCLQSITDMKDDEPRAPDDTDWRFRALECKRCAAATLAAIAALPAPGGKEVTWEELASFMKTRFGERTSYQADAEHLLSTFTITRKSQSEERV